jgi:hypothetical protein
MARAERYPDGFQQPFGTSCRLDEVSPVIAGESAHAQRPGDS